MLVHDFHEQMKIRRHSSQCKDLIRLLVCFLQMISMMYRVADVAIDDVEVVNSSSGSSYF